VIFDQEKRLLDIPVEEEVHMLVNVNRLKSKMDKEGLDGLVAATLPNVYYFAGFQSVSLTIFPYEGQCFAVITRDEPSKPLVVSSTGEIDQVLDGFPISGTVRFGSFFREGPYDGISLTEDESRLKAISVDDEAKIDPLEGLVTALEKTGLADKKVGLDELGLRDGYFDALGQKLPKAKFVRASGLFRWVRKVKTSEEIRRLRETAKIAERAMLAATAIAREGTTEYELVREFERSVVSQGARPMFTLLRIGRNGVAGQRIQDRTPLSKGDIIWFDVGVNYQGYWSDIARNFSLGEPTPRARTIFNAMLEGEKMGIMQTCVGMTGEELFNLTIKATQEAGCSGYRRHHVGHGIGTEVYEPPLLAPGIQDIIEEGSVINIETPYYEFGLGALHVEDPYVVKADGNHELLTTLSRELHIIDI
jgi:Xaa-Pro dipeptidase